MNIEKVKSLLSGSIATEPDSLNNLIEEAVNLARHYAGMTAAEFDAKIANVDNGYICLAWYCEYFSMVKNGVSASEEYLKILAKNYEIASSVFGSWKINKVDKSIIGKIEGLFE